MIIKKAASIEPSFSWLTLIDNIPDCEKVEITKELVPDCTTSDLKVFFFNLFENDMQNLVVGPCAIGVPWNDFADISEKLENFVQPTGFDEVYDNIYEFEFV